MAAQLSSSPSAVSHQPVVASGEETTAVRQYACLYTRHKTQKRKVWKDGRLVVRGFTAVLHDAHPPPGSSDPSLDQCELSRANRQNLGTGETHMEMEQHLIQIEGLWTPTPNLSSIAARPSTVSNGMKKLLQRKFRKPDNCIPPHPSTVVQPPKRKRPLQPGELIRRHYGSNNNNNNNNNPPPSPPHSQAVLPHHHHHHHNMSAQNPFRRANGALPQYHHGFQQQQQQPSRSSIPQEHDRSTIEPQQRPPAFSLFQADQQGESSSRPPTTTTTSRDYTRPTSMHQRQQEEQPRRHSNPATDGGVPQLAPRDSAPLPVHPTTSDQTQDENGRNPRRRDLPPEQSFVQQQQTTSSRALFSSNGFDPSMFYGEEEESEEDRESSQDDHGFVWSLGADESTKVVDSQEVTRTAPSQSSEEPTTAILPRTDDDDNRMTMPLQEQSTNKTLSANRLLTLFGAPCLHPQNNKETNQFATEEVSTVSQPIPTTRNSSLLPNEQGRARSIPPTLDTRTDNSNAGAAREDAPPKEDEETLRPKEPIASTEPPTKGQHDQGETTEPPQLDFFLPSASESDDSSQDSD